MGIEISLIIPTYNREQELKRVLDSIKNQTLSKDKFEVIIIDDGSEVRISAALEKFPKTGLNISSLSQENRGPAGARNAGIKRAKGRIFAFTDDDCILTPDWLEKMYNAHNLHPEIAIIGGNTYVKKGDLKALLSQFLANNAIWAKKKNKKEIIFFPTCNVSLKKEVFNYIWFNENNPYPGGEDLEFFWQLYLKGYKFLHLKEAVIWHLRETSFLKFISQPYIYGKGNFLVQRKFSSHPALLELKNSFKFLFSTFTIGVFSIYITRILAKKYNLNLIDKSLVFIYLILYRIAYFSGYLIERIKFALKEEGE